MVGMESGPPDAAADEGASEKSGKSEPAISLLSALWVRGRFDMGVRARSAATVRTPAQPPIVGTAAEGWWRTWRFGLRTGGPPWSFGTDWLKC